MKLFVQNLGVVSEAEIDLSKDFILFTGQNNTGKTYLAYLVYMMNREKSLYNLRDIFVMEKNVNYNEDNEYILDLKAAFSDERGLNGLKNAFSQGLKESLQGFFSANKLFFEKTFIELNFEKEDFIDEKIKEIELNENGINSSFGFIFISKKIGDSNAIMKRNGNSDLSESGVNFLSIAIQSFLIYSACQLIQKNTIIFPSMREGISLFHKELSMIKNKVFDGLTNGNREAWFKIAQRFNRYPKPIKDMLEFAQNLDVIRKETSEFAYLADELEAAFLGGKVEVNNDGDLQFLLEDKQVLEIHMASSTVKSLSYLAVYLRHSAKKGDFIIIDEPELNLHPDNQRKIARFFGRLINEGFKILISTHSDYIVREVNNLIMLNSGFEKNKDATKQLLAKHNYQENQLLDKNRVGAYLFKMGEKVQNLPIEDTGFSVPTIDDEIQKLNQTTNDILFELFD